MTISNFAQALATFVLNTDWKPLTIRVCVFIFYYESAIKFKHEDALYKERLFPLFQPARSN